MGSRSKPKQSTLRNVQLIRTLTIIRELDRVDGVDLYELAERHGTNVRTIRRDLEGLQAAGLPIAESESDGKRKRWRVAYNDKLAKVASLLDVSHYLALRVAMDGSVDKKSSLFTALEDLADKIEDSLGRVERDRLRAIAAAFHSYGRRAYREAAPDVVWPLVAAIAERRFCRVTYRAAHANAVDKEIRLLPLRMFVHDQAVYLHAYVSKHDKVITLNLQRLKDLHVLEERGIPPASYDPNKWEAAAFGVFGSDATVDYQLRFSSEIAPLIRERMWHLTQSMRMLSDGRLELRFTCGESPEVTAWVASWRQHVEVLAPKRLREELRAVGERLVELYR